MHSLPSRGQVLDTHLNAFQYLEGQAQKLEATLSQADRILGAQANNQPQSMMFDY